MSDTETIQTLQGRLNVYRHTLAMYLEQRAKFGSGSVPPAIQHGIAESRANIKHLKENLRMLGEWADDHPDDDEVRLNVNPTCDQVVLADDPRAMSAAIIIHTFSLAAGSTGFAVSLIPTASFGADVPILVSIGGGMVISLGVLFKQKPNKVFFSTLIGQASATLVGFTLAKGLLSLIPVVGNIANTAVAFLVTEALGWGVFLLYTRNKDINNISVDELIEAVKEAQKMPKPDVKKQLARMSSEDKMRYDSLQKGLKNKNLTEEEQTTLINELAKLTRKYAHPS